MKKKMKKKFKIEENLEEIKPKRSEPLPEIKNFAANLLKFSFEPEKFTCFFCNPCQSWHLTTEAWEIHMETLKHKKIFYFGANATKSLHGPV